jgi:hypothetical protein
VRRGPCGVGAGFWLPEIDVIIMNYATNNKNGAVLRGVMAKKLSECDSRNIKKLLTFAEHLFINIFNY